MISRLLLFAFFALIGFDCYSITFERKHFKPTGKNFVGSKNILYFWHTDKSTDKITMLYYKATTGVCVFKGFEISKSLEDKLPLLVIKYIGKYVTSKKLGDSKSLNAALDATKRAVDIALDQKYKELILNEGKALVQDSGYFRGHFHSKWWMPNYYYDYIPAFSKDTVKTFLTNSIVDKAFPYLYYISDSLKFLNYHNDAKSVAKWGDVFKRVRKSPSRKLSDWAFVKGTINGLEGFHQNSDSCRFTLSKVNMTHGQKYPVFASVAIFGWHATYCNFYASDLRKVVFEHTLFTTKGCKTDCETLKSKVDFVQIPKSEAAAYATKGFYVFLINDEHITTIYPAGNTEIDVIQAGEKTGIHKLSSVWGNFSKNNSITCYIYLGHLNKAVL